jgi:CMP-N-acetylneuraminic acid synthetase
LSGDDSASVEVAYHAVQFVEAKEGFSYDLIFVLQPTAPLRTGEDIDSAIELLENSNADAVVGVVRVEEPHPVKMMILTDGFVFPLFSDRWNEQLRRQQLEPVYRLNGAVYCVRRDTLVQCRSLWGTKTLAYVMPPERSVNIDTTLDLMLAELILKGGDEDAQNKAR